MMRIASLTFNEARECMGSAVRDEKQISTYILSYQIAEQMLKRYGGNWSITGNEIVLESGDLEYPVIIDVNSGTLHYGSLLVRFYHRYTPTRGVSGLVEDLFSDLAIPVRRPEKDVDFLFRIFVKLIEIFHARCDLRILPKKSADLREWEIRLSKDGPSGWISEDGTAENRFGQKTDVYHWVNLRPEKVATYLFGFNRFCKNFQCPMK